MIFENYFLIGVAVLVVLFIIHLALGKKWGNGVLTILIGGLFIGGGFLVSDKSPLSLFIVGGVLALLGILMLLDHFLLNFDDILEFIIKPIRGFFSIISLVFLIPQAFFMLIAAFIKMHFTKERPVTIRDMNGLIKVDVGKS